MKILDVNKSNTGIYSYCSSNSYLYKLLKIIERPEPTLQREFFLNAFFNFMNKRLKIEHNERGKVIKLIKHPFITNHLYDKNNFPDFLADLFEYMSFAQ